MMGTSIPYQQVPHTSPLFLDYLYHFDRVSRFYNAPPYEISSYEAVVSRLQNVARNRRDLCAMLMRQNKAFGCGAATFENLRRLEEGGSFAVVTGQQVGLFSGPAFTIFKALTTVRLANYLTEQGIPVVPVFWFATEDHDLAEVAEVATLDDEYNLVSLADHGDSPSPRSPVGNVRLTPESTQALARLEACLPTGPPREALLQDLRETYTPGATWVEAFGGFMARLLSRWGVIFLNPLDPAVHQLSAEVYAQALERAPELRAKLLERSQSLIQSGYHAQVKVAENSTLVFVVREGNRLPIHQQDRDYLVEGAQKTRIEELRRELADNPMAFSPNALFRPLVQDSLLPTIAYVAGPSELAYLGQAQVLYEAFGRPQPVFFPRAAFTLVDHRVQRLLDKYRLSVEEVWLGEEHVSGKIAAVGLAEGWSERFDQAQQDLASLLGRLRGDIETLDPTLVEALQTAQEKIHYQMDRLRGKVSRAGLARSELLARHAQALTRFLTPQRDLQERRVGGAYFLGRAGYELLPRLLSQIRTDGPGHQVASL
ncbi:MAG TPA: bacillithiol biosynthesis cysteine-adding enzyme BshC [Terriglobia bacterium]|nr:bacillithiol biosynthesis cysteine-adding enzyme BshC [Terriglobia bacterium]